MNYVYRGDKPLTKEPKVRQAYGSSTCGTNAAYQAHKRKGEYADDACYQAHLQDQKDRRERRKQAKQNQAT